MVSTTRITSRQSNSARRALRPSQWRGIEAVEVAVAERVECAVGGLLRLHRGGAHPQGRLDLALGRGLAKRTREQVRTLYADLAAQLRDGVLKAPIDALYPIEDIKSALIRAQQGGRNGKVLVLPNGPL